MKTLKLVMVIVFMGRPLCAWGNDIYSFNCHESRIQGTIKYAVIGRYQAVFDDCQGTVVYDPQESEVKSVDLKIKTISIHSPCPWCDRIVTSRQLLDAEAHPWITFTSQSFQKAYNTYKVKGTVDLHGISKTFVSPFQLQRQGKQLRAQGTWVLNRKDFKIIWNSLLDHGGIVVGDNLSVNWQVVAHRQ